MPSEWTAGMDFHEYGSLPRMVSAAGGSVWSPYFRDVSSEAVREAHALGLRVVVWTVNETRDIEQMLEIGVDGIITDRPDLARKFLTEIEKKHAIPVLPAE